MAGSTNEECSTEHGTVIDETTPLIASANAGPIPQANAEPIVAKQHQDQDIAQGIDEDEDDKPLPRTQILALCVARLVEPIAFFSIFSFINEMVWLTGNIKKTDVGFYTGLIESLFSLTQMGCMMFWGRAADRFGRKPVLVSSLLGIAVFMTLFGFSRTIWQMVLFRCLAGMFSGSLITIRVLFTELSTKKTQARAFSFFAVSGNFGIFLGPLIGGALSNPVRQIPAVFGNSTLFRDYPYALSGLATGVFGLVAALVVAFLVEETLPTKGKTGASLKPMSTMDIIRSPGVATVLLIYSWGVFLALGHTAVVTIYWFTPVSLGGFGWDPPMISVWLAIAGASQALWTLIVFPAWHKRSGTIGILIASYCIWPMNYLLLPLMNQLAKHGLTAAFWTVITFWAVCGSAVAISFTSIQLALNDISPSHETLGTVNAIALTIQAGIRAVAPAAFASLYAESVREQWLSGQLVYYLIAILTAPLALAIRWLPEKAWGLPKKPVSDST